MAAELQSIARCRCRAMTWFGWDVVVAVVVFGLVGCGDVVTTRYRNVQEARGDQLFARGWLPDVLPPSANTIRVTNNLDLNTSAGEFHFDPREFDRLRARLDSHSGSEDGPITNFIDEVRAHQRRGLPALQYRRDRQYWVFLCDPKQGVCEYMMGPER